MRDYEAYKERQRLIAAESSRLGRDIGRIPAVKKPLRKIEAIRSYRSFNESYFPKTFYLPWSADHLKVIARIQDAVLKGELFGLAMSRGSGKSALLKTAALWAVLGGHRQYVCLIGSDEKHAARKLRGIKTELEGNPLLLEDFPEVVHPIHCLNGLSNKAPGQLYRGESTRIGWTSEEIVLPTIAGSQASGAIIQVAGLLAAVRGLNYTMPDGTMIRPSLVFIDDPQTDESARSLSQNDTREEILAGAILGLAGPDVSMAGILLTTVIAPGDMADRVMNRDLHPEWRAERMKMLYAFPTRMDLWEEYGRIRAEELKAGGDGSKATEFYRENQAAMDEGAEVAWPARKNPGDLSALQHAMNLYYRNRRAFMSEMQNTPEQDGDDEGAIKPQRVLKKLNGRKRREIPAICDHVSAMIDVHDDLLYYAVCAWRGDFSGYVIDYGTFPEQRLTYFRLRQLKGALASVAPKGSKNKVSAIHAGIVALLKDLFGRVWMREDGAELGIGCCLIDSGYKPETVREAILASALSAQILPSLGEPITASNKPISEWQYKPGDRKGHYWGLFARKRGVRTVQFDANFWKSRLRDGFLAPVGEPGCITIFGNDPATHALLVEHLAAEYPTRTEGRGRKLEEWKVYPGVADNHWLDTCVGCAVGASLLGVVLPGGDQVFKPKQRRKASLADLTRKQ